MNDYLLIKYAFSFCGIAFILIPVVGVISWTFVDKYLFFRCFNCKKWRLGKECGTFLRNDKGSCSRVCKKCTFLLEMQHALTTLPADEIWLDYDVILLLTLAPIMILIDLLGLRTHLLKLLDSYSP